VCVRHDGTLEHTSRSETYPFRNISRWTLHKNKMPVGVRGYEFIVQSPSKPAKPVHKNMKIFCSESCGNGEWQCYINFNLAQVESLVHRIMAPLEVSDLHSALDGGVDARTYRKFYPTDGGVLCMTGSQQQAERSIVPAQCSAKRSVSSALVTTSAAPTRQIVLSTEYMQMKEVQSKDKIKRLIYCKRLGLMHNEDSKCKLHPEEKFELNDEYYVLEDEQPKPAGLDYVCILCELDRREEEYKQSKDPYYQRVMLPYLIEERDKHMEKYYAPEKSRDELLLEECEREIDEADHEKLVKKYDEGCFTDIAEKDREGKVKNTRDAAVSWNEWTKQHNEEMNALGGTLTDEDIRKQSLQLVKFK